MTGAEQQSGGGMATDTPLLRLSQAAALTQLSIKTLQRAMHAPHRRLPHLRIGNAVRIRRDDLDQWLREHAATPQVSGEVLERISATARELIESVTKSAPTRSGKTRQAGDQNPGDAASKARSARHRRSGE